MNNGWNDNSIILLGNHGGRRNVIYCYLFGCILAHDSLLGCGTDCSMTLLQAYLTSCEFGSTVDQVEALIRKHDAFDKVLEVQEDKVSDVAVLSTIQWKKEIR